MRLLHVSVVRVVLVLLLGFGLSVDARAQRDADGSADVVLDVETGLRVGIEQVTHSINVPSTTLSSPTYGASADLVFRPARSGPYVGLLAGLDVTVMNLQGSPETLTDETRTCTPDCGTLRTYRRSEVSTSAVVPALRLGVRGAVPLGPVEFVLQTAGAVRLPIGYDASIETRVVTYEAPVGAADRGTESSAYSVPTSADPWSGPQLGLHGRLGVVWNRWSVGLGGTYGLRNDANTTNASSDDGGMVAPNTLHVGLVTAVRW